MRRKMLKSICAVVLSIALTVTGVNVDGIYNAVAGSQETVQKETKITAEQKEKAQKEDEKVREKLKQTKLSKETNKKATVVKELKDFRTTNSTTYLLSNGSRKLEIYGEDIRYKENGKYVDYDPSLKKISKSETKELAGQKVIADKDAEGNYAYVNTAGDAKNYFPENLDEDSAVVMVKKSHAISFVPVRKEETVQESSEKNRDEEQVQESLKNIEDAQIDNKTDKITDEDKQNSTEKINKSVTPLKIEKKSVREDNLTYSDGKTISYQYTSLKNGVKEEIILEEKPETNIFEFKLNLPGMKMETFEDSKEIRIVDKKTKKLVACINEPNIQDVDGRLKYDEVHYEIEEGKDGENILKVVADKDYLNSEHTKYPVTIDPTVWWVNDRLESASVTDFEYTKSMNLKHTNLIQIYNKSKYGPYTTSEDACYIDTSGIDKNNAMVGSTGTFYGSDIKEAYLNITERDNKYSIGASGSGTFVSGNVEVRTPVSTWDPDTITWNNHPPMGDKVWSQFKCTGATNTWHKVDLKDWAQAVADRSIENTGLALKCVEEGTGANFYSSSMQDNHYMCLIIVYEDPHIGEKDIYTYEDFSTPNGSGKIELSQGNFMYRQEDLALPTPQLGLEIIRTYNSRNTEQSNFGSGWTCGYDARILKDSQSTTYIDETGAIYKLYNKDGTIYGCDENPDLSLEIKTSTQTRVISATETNPSSTVSFTSIYIITDKDKVKRYFDADGKLRLIEEANGTFTYIKYHSTFGLIQSIHSSKGQKIDFEFAYSGGDYFISKTTLADGSSFNYTYTDKRLTKVTHRGSDDNEIVYKYEYNSSGQMSRIIDAMGTVYRIEYDGKSVSSAIYPDNSRIDVYTNYEPLKTRVYTKNPNNMILHYEEYEFDVDGKVLKTTKDSGKVSTYSYDGSLVTNTTEEVQYHELQSNIVKTITPTGEEGDKHLEEVISYDDRNNVKTETDEEGNVTEYTYGDSQNADLETKVKEISADGVTTSEIAYEYDNKGNLIKETDYIEKTVTRYTYDNDGNATESIETLVDKDANLNNVSSTTLSKGLDNSVDTSTFDNDGNTLTSSVTSGTISQTEENTYDDLGRIKTTTDEKNIVSSYEYDEFGRVKKTITKIPNKEPETTMTIYDLNGRVAEETDKSSRKTTYQYDSMGRVISKTLTYGDESRTTTTTYGYEDNFYVITGTGANKRLPTVAVVTEKNADNEVVSRTYTDPYGQTVREESNGICTDYTYDKQGNVFTTYTRGVGSTNPTSPKLVVTVYDKYGRLTDTIQNPIYRNGAFTVDATNSIVTSNKYDESGNLIEETDGKGNKTTYEYNEEGKLTKVSLPDGSGSANDTLYAYGIQNNDDAGNIISTTDTTTNALGYISETVKNGAGQVLSVEDKHATNSIKTSYEYDKSGNKTKETYSNGSYTIYSYDKKNLMISKHEFNAQNTWVKFTSYSYNKDDLLYKVIDYNVSNYTLKAYRYTIYEYDALGRMTGYSEINKASEPTESEINQNKLVYKYDIEDKLTEIRYPKASSDKLKGIKFEYNDYKWLVKIKGIMYESGTEVTRDIRDYEYYNDSKVKWIRECRDFLNGGSGFIQKFYQYDVFDRVTKMSYADSRNLASILEQYTYSYDKNSNIISETIINNYPAKQEEKVNETRTYTYDSLNRMVTSKKTDNISQTVSNASYTYDKVGNCTKSVEDGVTTYSTYNSLNQLVQRNVSKNGARVGLTFYSYDANGNQILEQTMVSPPTITETIQKEYDSNNQLMKVTCREGNASGTIKYTQENTYNYDGQRISKTDNGVTTHYYYQGGVLLYTTDNSGNKTSQNVVGPQENVIATIRYEDNGQHTYFYNKNIRTSVTNVVDESGNGVVSYKYDDYGTTIKYGNEDFYNEVCYTSGVYDELTGLYYLNARYYNPESATFITQDSYRGEQDDYGTWNLYAYCGGNPIAYVDLSGHKKKKSVKIPKGYGTTISYMGHHLIKAKSSDQYKLKARAKKDKKYKKKKPEYYAMIDNRILIATKANIGNKLKVSVGDYVNVKFKKSKAKKTVTYKCMIGDIKGADADNSWGHYGGQGVVEIIYHDYNPPKGYKKNKNNPWGKGKVTKIIKTGKKYKF